MEPAERNDWVKKDTFV